MFWRRTEPDLSLTRSEAPGRSDVDRFTSVLAPLFDNPDVDEVLVNGVRGTWVVERGRRRAVPPVFASEDAMIVGLLGFARALGVRLDPLQGSAGGMCFGGRFRWHCVLPPLAQDGPLLSVRRHRFNEIALDNFDGSSEDKRRLVEAVTLRKNLLIVGPTGSGKTSLLAALLRKVAPTERVLIVESTPEFPLISDSYIRLTEREANLDGVGAVSMRRLIAEALRLRPERLVVGEIRGSEAASYLELVATGHGGVAATLHACSRPEAVARLRQLASRFGKEEVPEVPGDLVVAHVEGGDPPRIAAVDQAR